MAKCVNCGEESKRLLPSPIPGTDEAFKVLDLPPPQVCPDCDKALRTYFKELTKPENDNG